MFVFVEWPTLIKSGSGVIREGCGLVDVSSFALDVVMVVVVVVSDGGGVCVCVCVCVCVYVCVCVSV